MKQRPKNTANRQREKIDDGKKPGIGHALLELSFGEQSHDNKKQRRPATNGGEEHADGRGLGGVENLPGFVIFG